MYLAESFNYVCMNLFLLKELLQILAQDCSLKSKGIFYS